MVGVSTRSGLLYLKKSDTLLKSFKNSLDAFGRVWTRLDALGRVWTRLDAFGRVWTC